MPQPAVVVDDAAHPQRGDALLQPPRRALGRRAVAEQRAEDGVGIGLAQPAEAHRPGAHGRLERAGVRAVEPDAAPARRRARSRPPSTPPTPPAPGRPPAPGTAAGAGGRAARRTRASARSGPRAARASRAAAIPARQQVQAPARGRVDRHDGLAAEAEDGAHDGRHVARLVERRHQLGGAVGPAARVQGAELLLGRAWPRRRSRSSASPGRLRRGASYPDRSRRLRRLGAEGHRDLDRLRAAPDGRRRRGRRAGASRSSRRGRWCP